MPDNMATNIVASMALKDSIPYEARKKIYKMYLHLAKIYDS